MSKLEIFPTIGSHESVLALGPKVFLRSLRSRFHYAETSLEQLKRLHDKSNLLLDELVDDLKKADLSEESRVRAVAFDDKVRGIRSKRYLIERAGPPIIAIDPEFEASISQISAILPGDPINQTGDQLNVERRRVMAEVYSAILHEMAAEFRTFFDEIYGVSTTPHRDDALLDYFKEWQKADEGQICTGLGA